MPIEIVIGDITKRSETAIVNAANSNLMMGGGVCGAIHKAAGPELEAECRTYCGCPVGEARITTGCNLLAKFVIHAVAPRWLGGTKGEASLLRSTYKSIFALTAEYHIIDITMPAIGTGIHRYPLDEAVFIAVDETKSALVTQNIRVVFCCYDAVTHAKYTVACAAAGFDTC
jgi:O-acetyl-ADP-ribose deacetylase (regulator of RNase III)